MTEWDGLPPSGAGAPSAHLLRHKGTDVERAALWGGHLWIATWGTFQPVHAAMCCEYVGPLLTPDEVEEKVAEAVKEKKIGETTYAACSTRAYFPWLGHVLLSKREYEKTAKDIGEYMRGVFAEGEGKLGPKEWRTLEYEIARVNNELVKAQRRQAMTDRTTLAALIERVEQATGPDRELDAEIAWLMHPSGRKRLGSPDLRRECFHLGLPEPQWVPWESVSSFHPHYTGSLDAALTLVPKGMNYLVGTDDDTPVACVFHPDGEKEWVTGATPALALVAAALRAMMEEMGDD